MLTFDKQTPDNPTYYFRSTSDSEAELRQDIVKVWVELLQRIRENRADGTWNRLLFECWCTQGFIAIYPQKRGDSPDLKKPTLIVSLGILNDIRRKVDETDDESQIRSLIAIAYIMIRGAIRNTYRKEPALSEVKRTLETNDFTCWTMKNDDVETLMKFDIFF